MEGRKKPKMILGFERVTGRIMVLLTEIRISERVTAVFSRVREKIMH